MINAISFPSASLVPIVDMPLLSDERWQELAEHQDKQLYDAISRTTVAITTIAREWRCSRLEAAASIVFDCDTLIDTCQCIAEAVTYRRTVETMTDEFYNYLKYDRYKGTPAAADDEFLHDVAVEMAHDDAWACVYINGIIDDYATMDEDEKESAVFDDDD